MNVLIHADAGPKVGLGHLSRCIVLAHLFKDEGASVLFITDYEEAKIILKKNGFNTIDFTSNISGNLLIVDSYKWTEEDFKKYHKISKLLLVIDDLADRYISCDRYLNHNIFAQDLNLDKINCKDVYIGPEYALISQNFKNLRENMNNDCLDICICFGGSDEGQYSIPVVQALIQTDITCSIKVVSHTDIEFDFSNFKNCTVDKIIGKELSSVLTKQTTLICGAGQTSLEALCANINFIPTVISSNQSKNALALKSMGIDVLDHFSPLEIARKCCKIFVNKEKCLSKWHYKSKTVEMIRDMMNFAQT